MSNIQVLYKYKLCMHVLVTISQNVQQVDESLVVDM